MISNILNGYNRFFFYNQKIIFQNTRAIVGVHRNFLGFFDILERAKKDSEALRPLLDFNQRGPVAYTVACTDITMQFF